MQQPPKPKTNAVRRRHSGSVKAVLLYVVAMVTVIVVHAIALHFDRIEGDEPPVRHATERHV